VFSWLTNAWRVPELRRRVLFTAAILAALAAVVTASRFLRIATQG